MTSNIIHNCNQSSVGFGQIRNYICVQNTKTNGVTNILEHFSPDKGVVKTYANDWYYRHFRVAKSRNTFR